MSDIIRDIAEEFDYDWRCMAEEIDSLRSETDDLKDELADARDSLSETEDELAALQNI